jgi:hypothetical protein
MLDMFSEKVVDLEAGVAPTSDAASPSCSTRPNNINTDQAQAGSDDDGILEPSPRLTGHQLFYIFVLDGLGGMAISAGANFAIAYAMYTTQDTSSKPIRLFQLPNTLAGDAAITTVVQCVLTWFVETALVRYDLRNRSVQPIGSFGPEPRRPWLRRFFFLDEAARNASPLASVGQGALRGLIATVLGFVLLWPVAVGALTAFGEPSGGDYVYPDRWTPQFFKFIYGGLLGLLTTPLMAMFWLVKAGWDATKQPKA